MTQRVLKILQTLVATGVLIGTSNAADYIDLRRVEPLTGDVAAGEQAAAVCTACHGANGISIVPMFPSIAGQPAEYLYHELLRYRDNALPESPMTPIVSTLDDVTMRDLAVYYASLPAATTAAPIADQAAFDRGARLFEHGDPAKGIPPCQGCHGIGAAGLSVDGPVQHRTYPILRHQQADYLIARLKEYRDKQPSASSTDFVMQAVASRLNDEAIGALALWLASAP